MHWKPFLPIDHNIMYFFFHPCKRNTNATHFLIHTFSMQKMMESINYKSIRIYLSDLEHGQIDRIKRKRTNQSSWKFRNFNKRENFSYHLNLSLELILLIYDMHIQFLFKRLSVFSFFINNSFQCAYVQLCSNHRNKKTIIFDKEVLSYVSYCFLRKRKGERK